MNTAAAPVVVLRALGLGDVLTVVPALRALRRRFPGGPLLLAGPRAPGQLLRDYGLVEGVVPTPGLTAAPPGRGLTGHIAVNLHGRGPQSHRLLLAGGPSRVLAFANREVAVPGPVWNDREHEVHRWCRLVSWGAGEAAAARCDPLDLYLDDHSHPDDHSHLDDHAHPVVGRPAPSTLPGGAEGAAGPVRRAGPVVIHPGSASASRRWPPERFAAVGAALARGGHPVVITGGSEEATMCRGVVGRAGLGSAADLAGRLTLPNLVGLLRLSRLLVCGDTGVAHLATALRTPSVLLFGPTAPQLWGPLVDLPLHQVIWHGHQSLPGDPHGPAPDPALLQITVSEVVQAALATLARPRDASFA